MKAIRNRIGSEQSGFTLVELMATIAVMITVMIASLGILDVAVRSEPEIADRNQKIQTAQTQLERLTREIRVAYDVVSAAPQSLVILTYVNRSSCAGTSLGTSIRCRVSYSCGAGSCSRTVSEPDGSSPGASTIVVDGISSSSIFSYAPDSSFPESVEITLSYPAAEPGEDAITVSDGVVMRNRLPGDPA